MIEGALLNLRLFADATFHCGASYDGEMPWLLIGARRRGASRQQRLLDNLTRDRTAVEIPHRATPLHQRIEVGRAGDHLVLGIFAIGGQWFVLGVVHGDFPRWLGLF